MQYVIKKNTKLKFAFMNKFSNSQITDVYKGNWIFNGFKVDKDFDYLSVLDP